MKLDLSCTTPQLKFHQLPNKYRLFVGGFGSGKTQALIDAAMIDCLSSSKSIVGIYSPTFDLIRLIHVPRIKNKLEELGVNYKYNQQSGIITTSASGVGDIIFRSMDNPERIIGYETYSSHIDELDTLKTEHARHAFQQIDGRNRQNIPGKTNRISVYTTPEGFRFVYDRWVKNPTEQFAYVQASSRSNPHLPPDYIDSLMRNYPAALIEAYIEGKFVNLTSGTVYSSYNVDINDSKETVTDNDREIFIGMDFNVGKMSAVVNIKRGDTYHAVDELTDILDTPSMCRVILNKYSLAGRVIRIYPDASGNSRKSVNGTSTDFTILEQNGFRVYADSQNPRVKDRVNTVNNAFEKKRYFINRSRCPKTSDGLIQQAWKNDEPDKTSGTDHLNDALGYFVCKNIGLNSGPTPILVRF